MKFGWDKSFSEFLRPYPAAFENSVQRRTDPSFKYSP